MLAWLAGRFAAAGTRTTILRFDAPSRPIFYRLDPAIELISLDLAVESSGVLGAIAANARRVRRLRAALGASAPDRVIAFTTETAVACLLAAAGSWPTIVAERCDPQFYPVRPVWRKLRDWTYPFAARVVFQTEAARTTLSPTLRGVVIPNPVATPPADVGSLPPPVDIVAMGRLTPQKGFDVLIEALARLPGRHAGARLRILGEGEARAALTERARVLGAAARVEMQGVIDNPAPYLRAARIFVLPSRYEGFPNALCEAMALGLPVIASDCPSGPREIVRDGTDGLLVPPDDPDALAAALTRLLDDPELRAALGARATDIANRFSADAVFTAWRAAIQD